MTKKVIVTVQCQGWEFDMELPADATLVTIRPVLLDALRSRGIGMSGTEVFVSGGAVWRETETLSEAGVWDGSYLEVVSERGK